MEWASTHGIVNGTGNRTFSPNDSISRKDMCVIMVRYCSIFGINLKSNSGNKFNDDSKISDNVRDYLLSAQLYPLFAEVDTVFVIDISHNVTAHDRVKIVYDNAAFLQYGNDHLVVSCNKLVFVVPVSYERRC